MSDEGTGSGWQPLSRPNLGGGHQPEGSADSNVGRRLRSNGAIIVSPFVRLARTHAFHAAGEASVFVTLAGTLLTIDPNDARSRILLALVLTMAPFAVVGPLIGPALDRIRGGRRATIAVTLLLRAGLMLLLMRNLDTSWFFPIAFVWLVLGKTYSVAKAATVPTTVDDEDELVEKNSRLAILSAVAGVAGIIPAAGLYRLFGATPTLWWAALIYLLGLIASIKMPRVLVDDPKTEEDDLDIRSEGVRTASIVMATLRGIVGFVFFLLVFEFVRSELPDLSGVGTAAGAAIKLALGFDLLEDPGIAWWKAAIPFALWGFGGFAGNVIAPWFRKKFSEEKMLVGAVGAIAVSAIAAVWAGGLAGAALVALIVGSSASAAKLAFDSLVQRDAPGANHGAAFGRFETSFQIAWVIGSLIAVIGPFPFRGIQLESFPLRAGFLVIAIAAVGLGVFIMQQGAANGGMMFGGDAGGRKLRRRTTQNAPAVQTVGVPPVQQTVAAAQQPGSMQQPIPGQQTVPGRPAQPGPSLSPQQQARAQQPVATEYLPTQQMQQVQPGAPAQSDPAQSNPARSNPAQSNPGRHNVGQHGQAPGSYTGADPYREAFADQKPEPPDWAEAVFDDGPPVDPLEPPPWLADGAIPTEPNPTPPMGTDQVD